MTELVDVLELGSSELLVREGSSPSIRTYMTWSLKEYF